MNLPNTRKEAKDLNVDLYFTGKRCKHGHVCERRTRNGDCVACVKERSNQHYQSNVEKYKERVKSYHENNREKCLSYSREYYQDNKEYMDKKHLEYCKQHQEQVQEYHKQYNKKYGKGYYKKNKQRINLKSKQYRKNNPHVIKYHFLKRRETLKNAIPSWYSSEEHLVEKIYKKRDQLNERWGLKFEVDHIIPLISDTVCGLHTWCNLQLLEESTNRSKHNHYIKSW